MDEKRITVALPEDLHTRLKNTAERERRSLTAQMLIYIERGLTQDNQPFAGIKKQMGMS